MRPAGKIKKQTVLNLRFIIPSRPSVYDATEKNDERIPYPLPPQSQSSRPAGIAQNKINPKFQTPVDAIQVQVQKHACESHWSKILSPRNRKHKR